MTRPILTAVIAISIPGLAACDASDGLGKASGPVESGWTTAPVIQTVTRTSGGLVVRGQAAPAGRIVLRGDGNLAYAVGADDRGRFGIRIRPPATDTLFVVEAQIGEDTAPAPSRLLVSRDPTGPVALIAPGRPTLRLDPHQGLDVIDTDGRTQIASGRAAAGTRVGVTVEDGLPREVTADDQGRWTLDLGPGATPPMRLSISGTTYIYPAAVMADGADSVLKPVGSGQQIRWALSATSHQTSWFPDRPR